jgi:predicted DNA-binding transcriptional regulator AlpA
MSTVPKLISLKQITFMLGCSISSAARYTKLPGFPAPYFIGGRKLWIEEEIVGWVMSCRRVR